MSGLEWAIAFVVMCIVLGGSALGSVALIERGKSKRLAEKEKTARIGMENAWQLEQAKLSQGQIGPPTTVSFELSDGTHG